MPDGESPEIGGFMAGNDQLVPVPEGGGWQRQVRDRRVVTLMSVSGGVATVYFRPSSIVIASSSFLGRGGGAKVANDWVVAVGPEADDTELGRLIVQRSEEN